MSYPYSIGAMQPQQTGYPASVAYSTTGYFANTPSQYPQMLQQTNSLQAHQQPITFQTVQPLQHVPQQPLQPLQPVPLQPLQPVPLQPISTQPTNPPCKDGEKCKKQNRPDHKEKFTHPCKHGAKCTNIADPIHARRFVHTHSAPPLLPQKPVGKQQGAGKHKGAGPVKTTQSGFQGSTSAAQYIQPPASYQQHSPSLLPQQQPVKLSAIVSTEHNTALSAPTQQSLPNKQCHKVRTNCVHQQQ